jgi:hypothetical protein
MVKSNIMKFIIRLFTLLVAFTPVFAFAAGNYGSFSDLTTLAQGFVTFINSTLVPLVFALAFLVFIWGVFRYFIQGGSDETARDAGKQLMLWGIIGFVVMISVWGIVNLISNGLFGTGSQKLDSTSLPQAPVIK